MKRRIIAWVLLLSFVLLLLNLIVFRFYWQLSMGVYLIIVFVFLITSRNKINTKEDDQFNQDDNNEQQDNEQQDKDDNNSEN